MSDTQLSYVPTEKYGDFSAMAQGQADYSIPVFPIYSDTFGMMMVIAATEEAVYITKEAAMAFFDLVERGE